MPVAPSAIPEAWLVERGDGRPIHVLGAEVIIKISTRDTGGAFAVFEGRTPALQGPPLHRHREQDEWWYILEGEYRFEVDGQEICARGRYRVRAARQPAHVPKHRHDTGPHAHDCCPGRYRRFL